MEIRIVGGVGADGKPAGVANKSISMTMGPAKDPPVVEPVPVTEKRLPAL